MASRRSKTTKWLTLTATALLTITVMSITRVQPTLKPDADRPLAIHGPGTPNVGNDLLNAAEVAENKDLPEEAAGWTRKALALREKVLGSDHPSLIRPLLSLALWMAESGQVAEAEPLAHRALAIAENHPSIRADRVAILCGLAALALAQEHRNESEAWARKALAFAESESPLEPVVMETVLNGAANFLFWNGHADEALTLDQRALAIREKLYGPDSLEVAELLEEMFGVYQKYEVWDEIVGPLKRVIAIRDRLSIPKDPMLFRDVYALAATYHSQQKYSEAEPLAKRVAHLAEEVHGADSPVFARCLMLQGRIAECLDHLDQAEPLLTRAFAILEKAPIKDDDQLTECANLLSWLYLKQGREDDHKAVGVRLNKIAMTMPVNLGDGRPIPVGNSGPFGPPQLVTDGKPAPTVPFGSPVVPPNAFFVGDVQSFFSSTPERFPSAPSDEAPKTETKKFPTPAYAMPIAIPDVLPDTIPADPTVQKTSGGDQNPVIPPTAPK